MPCLLALMDGRTCRTPPTGPWVLLYRHSAARLNKMSRDARPCVINALSSREFIMTDVAVARVMHVVAVVLWIGGVGTVTTVLLPAIRRSYPAAERFAVFHTMEARFARQARITTVIAGLSGFYMAWRSDAWERFQSADFWWMHAMVLTWFIFTTMLFVLEPLFLERVLARHAATEPEQIYRRIEWLHRCLLALSLVTIAGAVAGSAGENLFDW